MCVCVCVYRNIPIYREERYVQEDMNICVCVYVCVKEGDVKGLYM